MISSASGQSVPAGEDGAAAPGSFLLPALVTLGGLILTAVFHMVGIAVSGVGRRDGGRESAHVHWMRLLPKSPSPHSTAYRLTWLAGVTCFLASLCVTMGAVYRASPALPWAASLASGLVVLVLFFVLVDVVAGHYALRKPDTVLRRLGLPAVILAFPFLPVAFAAPRPVLRLRHEDDEDRKLHLGMQELRHFPHVRGVDRVVEEEAVEMMDSVREFTESTARDIMTPRTDLEGVPVSASRDEVLQKLRETSFSRILVYRDNLDRVEGVLLVKEVLLGNRENPFEHLREPIIVTENTRLPEILFQFQRARTHLAVVLDEYGGTAGIVTLHDLFERLIGEHIQDVEEEEESWIDVLDEDHAKISGRVELWEVNEELDLQLDEAVARTIGGYLFNRFGRLPDVSDEWEVDGGLFRVMEVENNRITWLEFERRSEAREKVPAAEEKVQ